AAAIKRPVRPFALKGSGSASLSGGALPEEALDDVMQMNDDGIGSRNLRYSAAQTLVDDTWCFVLPAVYALRASSGCLFFVVVNLLLQLCHRETHVLDRDGVEILMRQLSIPNEPGFQIWLSRRVHLG
ncbi:hypothetical protein, partial [Bradyrhizobium japonicum]|uniref:hypothetical protein n=1 Tax=Bradyrhizobium japonicum TaxID=375 RepID=UPI001BADC0CD